MALAREPKQQQRAAGHQVFVPEPKKLRPPVPAELGRVGVDQRRPAAAAGHLRQQELHRVVVRVEDQQQRLVGAAPADAGRLGAAVEQDAEMATFATGEAYGATGWSLLLFGLVSDTAGERSD